MQIIHFNYSPGIIATALRTRSILTEEQEIQMQQNYSKLTPLGYVGKPEEIAQSIAYLASDMSTFTTGLLFVSDGGLSLAGPR